MSATDEMQLPTLGQPGSGCRGCGWPLATDQRYCLNCGQRRAQPHVEYLDYLTPTTPPPEPPPTDPTTAVALQQPPRPPGQRDYAPLAAVAGVTILGVMLLIGVLIGRGNNDAPPAATAPPQVVQVDDAGGEEAGAAAGQADKPANGGGDSGQDKPAADNGGDKPSGGGLTSGGNSGSDAPVQASTEDLEALEAQSGEDYAEQSANLPDVIATPGEAPPTDNEDPGGGSSATTIK